ncbi:serpin family protein [Sunxiuqinia sp. A32]|uniref:serpin family protein n=1 Tax=Sunxiuqinia sp. A32 TaxID=3461496 RepID=UPI0040458365
MKKICSLFIVATFILVGVSCSQDDTIDPLPGNIDVDLKSEQIIAADNQFGLELFKLINEEENTDKNLMISPLSVSLALAMAYNGADGDTRSQMEEMLHKMGMSPVEINESYKYLVDALESHDPKVDLSNANSIFSNELFDVKPDFISTNQTYYNAEVEALDFTNTSATLDRVNDWVKDKTRDKIDRIIEEVSPQDVMYLINAIYFNGEWTYKFDSDDTENRIFFLENGNEIQVPTMFIEENFNYLNKEEFELLEMPYGGKKYSMLIFLPHENYEVDDVINQLTPSNMEDWMDNMNGWNKKVFLPKFEFTYENSLVDNLKALGMTDAFDASLSNFSGISDRNDLYISEVKHKSYIKVDERGTEAAAVTGITFEVTSVQPGLIFAVDHPFVFAIREKDTNCILFAGKVMNPLLKE